MKTPTECVESGIRLLSEHDPEWFRKVDEASLNMESSRDDVLGQVFGGWMLGLRTLGLWSTNDGCGVAYGFCAAVAHDEMTKGVERSGWTQLKTIWARRVAEIKAAAGEEVRDGLPMVRER